jgi:hypothetical protein
MVTAESSRATTTPPQAAEFEAIIQLSAMTVESPTAAKAPPLEKASF